MTQSRLLLRDHVDSKPSPAMFFEAVIEAKFPDEAGREILKETLAPLNA